MLLFDMVPPDNEHPLVVAVGNSAAQVRNSGLYGTVGGCALVVRSLSDGVVGVLPNTTNILYPGDAALQIFLHKGEVDLLDSPSVQDEAGHSTKTIVLEQPKHGRLIWLGDKGNVTNYGAENSYRYEPNKGYIGTDKAIFLTELAGHRIKVIQYIKVTEKTIEIDNYKKLYDRYCPRRTWLISDEQETSERASLHRGADLEALIANARKLIIFGSLNGASIGSSTVTGSSAQITLDNNAAGYGWYMDPAPETNEEFLPTSRGKKGPGSNYLRGVRILPRNPTLRATPPHSKQTRSPPEPGQSGYCILVE
ncbi:MAG: hypothetical protein JNJ60_08530 [Rhodocyclaceae bacterium]|nr:hypothetical protein [Rhodocyclaceae bacterium]